MSAQYKNINNTNLDKSILCNKSCDNGKVNLGQVRFLRTEGLQVVSLVERTVASVYVSALNDGIVTGDRPVPCCAALHWTRGLSTNAMLLYLRSC